MTVAQCGSIIRALRQGDGRQLELLSLETLHDGLAAEDSVRIQPYKGDWCAGVRMALSLSGELSSAAEARYRSAPQRPRECNWHSW